MIGTARHAFQSDWIQLAIATLKKSWKLLQIAEKSFRKLNGTELLPVVYEGRKFKNGIAVKTKTEDEKVAA